MKRVLSALVVALFVGSLACAQEPAAPGGAEQNPAAGSLEPVVVVAFSGYARLKSDLELLGKAADYPDLAKSLDGLLMLATQQQGLAGLVEDKPWGAVAGFGDAGPQGLAFVPVSDLQKLLGALAGLVGEPEDAGDGVWKIQKDGSSSAVFAKEADGWAFLALQPDHLREVPKDPQALLAGMNESSDLAVRLYVQSIPPVFRDLLIDKLLEAIDEDADDDGHDDDGGDDDGHDDDDCEQLLGQLAHRHLTRLAALAKEVDQVTVGWSIDQEGPRARLDLNITAVEGSHLAEHLAETAAIQSQTGGFLSSDAMFALDVNCPISEADGAEALVILAKLRRHLIDEIEDDDDLDDPKAKKLVQGLVDQVLDVAEATVKHGQCNLGASVQGDGPYTLVSGLVVADGAKLDGVLRKLVEIGAGEEGFPQVQLDVAERDGLHFHTLTVPLDDDDDDLREFYGDPLQVTVAFSAERAYVALGEHGVESLCDAIEKPAAPEGDKTALVHGRAALGKVLALAARQEPDNVQTARIAELFKGVAEDGMHLYIKPLANGVQVRLESEMGLLKVLGAAAKTATPGGF